MRNTSGGHKWVRSESPAVEQKAAPEKLEAFSVPSVDEWYLPTRPRNILDEFLQLILSLHVN